MKNIAISARFIYRLGVVFLLTGIGLRLVVFYQNRSLFIDEGNLARNIVEKSGFDFFQILDYYQYAPPLFLLVEKMNVLLFGANEYALRLWPMLAGMASLLLLFRISQKIALKSFTLLIPLLWLSLSPLFIRYSTEIKQYSTDTLVALLLTYFALRGWPYFIKDQLVAKEKIKANQTPGYFFFQWAILGGLVIWLSMPSVFVLAGIGLVYGWSWWRQKNFKKLGYWAAVIGVWLLSFGGYFWLILSKDLGKQELIAYHSQYFFPLNLHQQEGWLQLVKVLQSILRTAFGFTILAYIVGSAGVLTGIAALWTRHRRLLFLILSPILFCLGASALGFYSLIPRLTLFFIPFIWLLFAFGISFLWEKGSKVGRLALGLALLLILPLQKGYEYVYKPLKIEEIRPVLSQLRQHYQEGDWVYIDHEAKPAFLFYQELHQNKPVLSDEGYHLGDWDETPSRVLKVKTPQPHRIWLVYSHLVSAEALDKLQQHLSQLPEVFRLIKKFEEPGAAVYLFEKV